ncbi:hypothetical protein AB9F42_34925, partial [Rhizobium leguminosarum]
GGSDRNIAGQAGLRDEMSKNSLREKTVRQKFWPTFRRAVRQIPFSRDVVAGFYCAPGAFSRGISGI